MLKVQALPIARLVLVALALAQVADVLSTQSGLAHGGSEANPVMAWNIEHLGALWPVPKALLGAWLIWQAISLTAITRRQVVILSALFKVYAITLLSNTFHWL